MNAAEILLGVGVIFMLSLVLLFSLFEAASISDGKIYNAWHFKCVAMRLYKLTLYKHDTIQEEKVKNNIESYVKFTKARSKINTRINKMERSLTSFADTNNFFNKYVPISDDLLIICTRNDVQFKEIESEFE